MITQRWRDRRDSYRPAGEVIDTHRHEVALIDDDRTAKAFITTHHYSATYPAARVRVGLYEKHELVGVAVFSHPVQKFALRPLPIGLESVELGRFVLLDRVAGNGETWFLARAFELLKSKGITGVVSFSDPFPRTTADGRRVFGGHVGTIYQAHNAVYLGRAKPNSLRLLPDGRTIHSRAISKIRFREQGWRYAVDMLVEHGAREPKSFEDLNRWLNDELPHITRSFRHPGNHKYVWSLDAREQRRLRKLAQPYPKMNFKEIP